MQLLLAMMANTLMKVKSYALIAKLVLPVLIRSPVRIMCSVINSKDCIQGHQSLVNVKSVQLVPNVQVLVTHPQPVQLDHIHPLVPDQPVLHALQASAALIQLDLTSFHVHVEPILPDL